MQSKITRFRFGRFGLPLLTFLILFTFAHSTLHARQSVRGKVFSAEDQTPLAGSTIKGNYSS